MLGHQRRYTKKSVQDLAEECGFSVKTIVEFNRMGTPAWFVNGKIFRRRALGLLQIWLLNFLTPVFRWLEPILPFPGLSLIVVLQRERTAHETPLDRAFVGQN